MSTKLPGRNEKGFTLIELMIVIAIIGILAAIAIPQFSNYRIRANNSAALSDARNFATAQEVYYTDNNLYAGGYASLSGAGFRSLSKGVTILNNSASATMFTADFRHEGGDTTYRASSATGVIEP